MKKRNETRERQGGGVGRPKGLEYYERRRVGRPRENFYELNIETAVCTNKTSEMSSLEFFVGIILLSAVGIVPFFRVGGVFLPSCGFGCMAWVARCLSFRCR